VAIDPSGQNGVSDIPSPDEAAPLDRRLMHDLSAVNYCLAQYMVRYCDADAGRAEPISITDELALAERFATAAEVLRARAARRWSAGEALKVGSPVDGEPV
jgi:hypothetical protein